LEEAHGFKPSPFIPTPPPAQAHAHDTHAHAQAQVAQAQTQSAFSWAGSCEAFADEKGRMAFANFSMLTTIELEVFSTDLAMLLAKSAPGIDGALPDCIGVSMLGL
jgi:hypothetical protein